MESLAPIAVIGFMAFVSISVMRIGRRAPDLPPGPPTIPLLGNIHIFPKLKLHQKLTEWARLYGGIYSLKMGPETVIVLTDMTIVKDLMEKRAQVTIDRPPMHIADRISDGMHLGAMGYSDQWRRLRRASQELLTSQACMNHLPIQRAESSQLLHDCLVDPKRFYTHITRYSTSVILSALHGKRAPRPETQEICDFFEGERLWQAIMAPGATPPIDFLPFLKYVPTPLASWKTRCDRVRYLKHKLFYGLLRETEERIAQQQENGSFIEQVLARQAEFGLSREQVGYLGGVMIEAGAGTTASWIQSLVLGLVAFPEVQKKAREELDRVVGHDRMPRPEDFPHLPYIQSIVKECHRWRPPGPLAVPHATTEEITYRGFRIPARTTIFINTWGMGHDPDVYDRPEDFWPDRWMVRESGAKPGVDDTDLRTQTWFGSGRRSCPGVYLAYNGSMTNAANLLWTFEFGPEIEPTTGKPIPVDIFNYSEGLGPSPNPFECSIRPRSAHHAKIVEHEFAAAEATFILYENGLREEDKAFVEAQRK